MIVMQQMFLIYSFMIAPSSSLLETFLACEPIIPLMQLLAGSSTVGLLLFAHSFEILVLAVVFKTVLFTIFESRLNAIIAVPSMIFGNVISTIVGIAMAGAASSGGAMIFFIFIVFVLAFLPASRLAKYSPWGKSTGVNTASIAVLITLLYILTFIFFGMAQVIIMTDYSKVGLAYWGIKVLYIFAGLAVSIFLTSAWEEIGINCIAKKATEVPYFLPAVLRANLYTMLMVFVFAAVVALPTRFNSPNFLL